MDIVFANAKLRKQLNEAKAMIRAHGPERARKLKLIMVSLRGMPHLGVLAPPYSPPHRCHELKGNRKGKLSLDLDGPYRLIIEAANNPLPQLPDGGLDWAKVTAIRICSVEDTHG